MNVKKLKKNLEEVEDEDDDLEEGDVKEKITARPRRMSELSVKKGKKPIPKGSAFFIFSHTNR